MRRLSSKLNIVLFCSFLFSILTVTTTWGANPGNGLQFTLTAGKDHWGYGGANDFVSLRQPWNGESVTLETKVYFPLTGTPGAFPRESWYGIIVEDTVHAHRYVVGPANKSWDMNPADIRFAVVAYENASNYPDYSTIYLKDPNNPNIDFTVPKTDKFVRLRLEFIPGQKLSFSIARPGGSWITLWDRWHDPNHPNPPANLSLNQIGLCVESYHPDESYGPVSFAYFRVTGNGPARTLYFTPGTEGEIENNWTVDLKNRANWIIEGSPLPPPTSLSGERKAVENWQNVLQWVKPLTDESIEGYKIYRKTENSSWGYLTTISGSDICQYIDTDSGTFQGKKGTYYYRVSAVFNITGEVVEGEPSNEISVALAPQGIIKGKVTNSQGDPIEKARVFILENGESQTFAETDAQGNYWLNAIPAGHHMIRVFSRGYIQQTRDIEVQPDMEVEEDFQLQFDEVRPRPPIEVSAQGVSPGVIKLQYTLQDNDITMVRIYRAEASFENGGGDGIKIFTQESPVPFSETVMIYMDTTAGGGKQYWYRVQFVDAAGWESEFSDEVSAQAEAVALPSLLAPENGIPLTEELLTFTWSTVADTAHYLLQLAQDSDFKVNLQEIVVDGANANYTIQKAKLTEGSWFWRVKAILNTFAESDFTPARSFSIVNPSSVAPGMAFVGVVPQKIAPLRKGDVAKINFVLNKAAFVTVRVMSLGGRVVKTLQERQRWEAQITKQLEWDGKDFRGKDIPNGLYLVVTTIEAEGEARRQIIKQVAVAN